MEDAIVMKPTNLKIGDRFKDKQTGKTLCASMIMNTVFPELSLDSRRVFWI